MEPGINWLDLGVRDIANTRSAASGWLGKLGLPESWRRSMKKDTEKAPEAVEAAAKKPEGETGSLFDQVVEEEKPTEEKTARVWGGVQHRTIRDVSWLNPPLLSCGCFHFGSGYIPLYELAALTHFGLALTTQHRFKSALHKMSHRKLNVIGRLVDGMPVDEAILQLQFSEKRAAQTWVKSTLAFARDHAIARGMRREKLVVDETWVSKGHKDMRIDIKGRGRMGVKHHPRARIHFVLKEGKTHAEKMAIEHKKVLHKVRSAGMVREDGKLRRKMTSNWAW